MSQKNFNQLFETQSGSRRLKSPSCTRHPSLALMDASVGRITTSNPFFLINLLVFRLVVAANGLSLVVWRGLRFCCVNRRRRGSRVMVFYKLVSA
jgi:hypothetical protein